MTRLEIISDPVCPWCYIGATNLDRAIEASGFEGFERSWRPFQLNPDMPSEGMDRRAYLEAKFGGAANASRVYARVEEAAAQAGLAIDFARIPRAPNTLDAHRLIRWAGVAGVQTEVVMALFQRYFETCEDISDPAVLCSVAEASGMDGATVVRDLAAGVDRAETSAEAAAASRNGISGVPAFILGGRYMLSGAQPPETWTRVIAEIAAATADPLAG